MAHLFQPVEEIIRSKFLPTIFGQDISQLDREIFALPILNMEDWESHVSQKMLISSKLRQNCYVLHYLL